MTREANEIEQAVSRSLRESLEKLQRNAEELNQAVADLVAACASSRPSNSLSPILRAQSSAASLAASLEVLSRFVANSMQSLPRPMSPVELAPSPAIVTESAPAAAVSTPALVPAALREPAAHVQAPPEAQPEPPEPEPTPEPLAAVAEPMTAFERDVLAEAAPESSLQPPPEPSPEAPLEALPESLPESAVAQEAAVPEREVPEPPVFELPVPEPPIHEPTAHEPAVPETVAPAYVSEVPTPRAYVPQAPITQASVVQAAPQEASAHDASVPEAFVTAAPIPEAFIVEPAAPHLEIPVPNPLDAYHDAYNHDVPPSVIADAALELQAPETPEQLHASDMEEEGSPAIAEPALQLEDVAPAVPAFNVMSLPMEQQELHRRANRVAKVSMQDIKMLRPKDVTLARENKDICGRLRDDIERAHKEYDRRFQTILGHPVDYFYDWMVQILGDGDPEALGEYPYPSPVLRH